MTAGARLRFHELMTGHVTFGEPDAAVGAITGRESATRLSLNVGVEVADVERVWSDPHREAALDGAVWCEALGGELALTGGTLRLFPADGPRRQLMRYRAFFADAVGHPLTLAGVKVTAGNPGLRVWRDTTTLYARVLWGHVEEGYGGDPGAGVVASGILRLRPDGFARLLLSFRAAGLTPVARFDAGFLGQLWRVYGRRDGTPGR